MDAYVFFDKRRTKRFMPWHLFCSKKWSHCFVLLDYGNETLVCESLASGLTVIKDLSIVAQINHWKVFNGTAIVKVPLPTEYEECFRWRGIMTCVSIVKAILRINKPFILTPKSLFDYLKNHGGIIIYERK